MRYDITLVTTPTGFMVEIYDNGACEWLPERHYAPNTHPHRLLRDIDIELNGED